MTQPPPRPTVSNALVLLLFVAGVLCFLAAIAGLAWWMRAAPDPANSLPFALRNASPAVPGEPGAGLQTRLDAARAEARKNNISLFFTPDGLTLRPQVIHVTENYQPHERLRFVLAELLRGPAAPGLRSTLPAGTELRGAYLWKDTVVVDLSARIARPLGGPVAEMLCVYAIVDSVLENVDGARTVRLLVNGQPLPVLWDQVDISGPLAADLSLIR